ncbi:hypothetical protein [Enterovibrio coralii]|uniref:hypothetical protein n=1 Tax=Enterovibrio coralii TaxID=294935 RepID=UPI001E645F9C|nr:hypothetical protein [Enterovibrio coralii]
MPLVIRRPEAVNGFLALFRHTFRNGGTRAINTLDAFSTESANMMRIFSVYPARQQIGSGRYLIKRRMQTISYDAFFSGVSP